MLYTRLIDKQLKIRDEERSLRKMQNINVPSFFEPFVNLQERLSLISDTDIDNLVDYICANIKEEYFEELATNICRICEKRPHKWKIFSDFCFKLSNKLKSSSFSAAILHVSDLSTGLLLRYLFDRGLFTLTDVLSKCNNLINLYFFFIDLLDKEQINIANPDIKKSMIDAIIRFSKDDFNQYKTNLEHGYECGSLGYLIKNDRIYEFIEMKSDVDVPEVMMLSLFDGFTSTKIPLVCAAAYYGSVNIFRFIVMNSAELPSSLPRFATMGGNLVIMEIVATIFSFDGCFEVASQFFQFHAFDFILNNSVDQNFSIFRYNGNYKSFLYLVQNYTDDLRIKDEEKKTLLHIAARNRSLLISRYLISKGLCPILEDVYGMNPLHEASKYGAYMICKYFLTLGFNINEITKNGWSCLHFAASGEHRKICKLLLKKGADPNIKEFTNNLRPCDVTNNTEIKTLINRYNIIKSYQY